MTSPGVLRERLGAAIFLKVAGDDGPAARDRIHNSPGERWFAPDSAIVRVHADASMFIGGMRALMLQSMHPVAMTAVAEHSGFKGDLWGRLARTSTYLATTTFAPADQAERSVAIVRSIHSRIHGTLADGTTYRADDPHLLMWVHIAEIDSFLRAHQRYGKQPLDQNGRDEYVNQTGQVASKLGVIDPPQTEAELNAVMASFRPELTGSTHARDAVRFLLFHPQLPVAARPGYLVLAAAAIAMMPAWTRPHLRLPLMPVAERTVVRTLGVAATGTIRWAMGPGPAQLQRVPNP